MRYSEAEWREVEDEASREDEAHDRAVARRTSTAVAVPDGDEAAAERYREDADRALEQVKQTMWLIFGDQLPRLAGQPEPLAQGRTRLHALIRHLQAYEAEADRLLLEAMGDERDIEVPYVGRVERYVVKDRPRWDSEGLLAALIRQALDPEGTGELPASPLDAVQAVVEVLTECAPFTPSLSWRKTPLKARGLLAGGKPEPLDEVDADGRPRLADRAGFLTFVQGDEKLRFPSLEGGTERLS